MRFRRDTLFDLALAAALAAGILAAAGSQAGTLSCSVAPTCAGTTIMKLSSATGGHAELATSSNYANLVCCTGVTGLSNTCDGTFATVAKLSGATNAHVERSSQANYNTQATCIQAPAGGTVSVGYQATNCSGYDTTVISMSGSLTNAESGDGSAYANKVCASAAAPTSMTFTTDSGSEAFPAVTPGTVSATSSILSVTTSNATGFVVSLARDNAAGTMALAGFPSTLIPDKTAWSPGVATTSAGNATASTTQPETLQFRVRQAGTDVPNYASAWWGSDDTTANALFAGFPSSAQTIINRSTAAGSGTTSYVLYNLNVPVTQTNGSYSGGLTYTATANP